MRTIRLSASDESQQVLSLGRRGENEATKVVFDFSAWLEQFGFGVPILLVKRLGDTEAYEVAMSTDGSTATWFVSSSDTAIVGGGKCEYWYAVDGIMVKSKVYTTRVLNDIGPTTEELPPDPWETWLEQMAALTVRMETAAREAASAAEDAAQAATSAASSKSAASSSEVATEAALQAAEAAQEAAEAAQAAAEAARQAAEAAQRTAVAESASAADSAQNAETSKRSAATSASEAGTSAANAASSASDASDSAADAEYSAAYAAQVAEDVQEALVFNDNGEGDISITWRETPYER